MKMMYRLVTPDGVEVEIEKDEKKKIKKLIKEGYTFRWESDRIEFFGIRKKFEKWMEKIRPVIYGTLYYDDYIDILWEIWLDNMSGNNTLEILSDKLMDKHYTTAYAHQPLKWKLDHLLKKDIIGVTEEDDFEGVVPGDYFIP